MKNVYLETFGCQMNVSDTERVATSLESNGYQITTNEESADIILLNTCSVRERAEHKLYTRVGRIRNSTGRKPIVGVMGCVAQLEGETLFDKIAGVDIVIGTKAVGRVSRLLDEVIQTGSRIADLGDREPDYDWSVSDSQRHSKYIAFLPIIEGCNKFCTYCIVPFSRGRESSLPASMLIRQVLELRRKGVREVHLIGQNVNSYRPLTDSGLEAFEGATPFAKLLRAVAATGMERIKFNTSFPRDFHPDIVDAIEENENLCNWVHLPVQSGSDRVLKMMRRGHSTEKYLAKIDRLRSSPRDIAITSDIIVGFPGETEADFLETEKLVEYCGFDSAYIFKYSPRPGTPAFEMEDNVSPEEKTRRFIQLEKVQKRVQADRLERYVGRSLKVLAERISTRDPRDLTGHSACQKLVNFPADEKNVGEILDIRIDRIKTNSLYGEVC
ncbi:MAG: tRNA (N6-isopentenyl adenosine(37)-C2)-methylthiotransferase MiaB [Acidobacteriota bacterium]